MTLRDMYLGRRKGRNRGNRRNANEVQLARKWVVMQFWDIQATEPRFLSFPSMIGWFITVTSISDLYTCRYAHTYFSDRWEFGWHLLISEVCDDEGDEVFYFLGVGWSLRPPLGGVSIIINSRQERKPVFFFWFVINSRIERNLFFSWVYNIYPSHSDDPISYRIKISLSKYHHHCYLK